MEIKKHSVGQIDIAEVVSDDIIVHTASDGLDIMGNVYYQGFDRMILHQRQLTPDFFDLRTGLAGEILQKFSNYRMQLVVVMENISQIRSQSLRDFIRESNGGKQVNFVTTLDEALDRITK